MRPRRAAPARGSPGPPRPLRCPPPATPASGLQSSAARPGCRPAIAPLKPPSRNPARKPRCASAACSRPLVRVKSWKLISSAVPAARSAARKLGQLRLVASSADSTSRSTIWQPASAAFTRISSSAVNDPAKLPPFCFAPAGGNRHHVAVVGQETPSAWAAPQPALPAHPAGIRETARPGAPPPPGPAVQQAFRPGRLRTAFPARSRGQRRSGGAAESSRRAARMRA